MGAHQAIHSGRIERWLGAERAEHISKCARGWYGPPILIYDVPGGVFVNGDGDFSGSFERGGFFTLVDSLESHLRVLRKKAKRTKLFDPNTLHVGGFTSLDNAIAQMSSGYRQTLNFSKTGTAGGATGAAVDLWYCAGQPAAGTVGSAAPGGLACVDTTTGALDFANPTGGMFTLLTGVDVLSTVASMSFLLYDRLFSVTKTMSSSATEAVTGVPTRYQSTTAGASDYIGGNFLFIASRTTLSATAHNWTVCQYTNQSGTGTATLPSVTGISAAAANRLDMPVGSWFAPLASGDTGIMKLTQMQSSVTNLTGAIDFNIGHTLGFFSAPIANFFTPYDWLTNRDLCPRIFDNAALAFMQLPISANTATTITGTVVLGQG